MSLKVNDQGRNEEKQANKRFDTAQYPFPSTKLRNDSPVSTTGAVLTNQTLAPSSTPVVSSVFVVGNQTQNKTSTPVVSNIIIGVT